MNDRINTYRMHFIRMVLFITMILAFSIQLFAQDKIVNVQVNKFWGGVSEQGAKTGYTHNNLFLFADYDAYGARLQGNETYFGGYIAVATSNWTDNTGKTIPFAVFPPANSYMTTGKVIKPLENYVRYPSPVYNIEQKDIPPIITNLGTVDATKCIGTSDQSVTVTNEYACGVQVVRKILAWGQQFHDGYVVSDLTFTNVSGKTLTGFYVAFQEGIYYRVQADGNTPAIAAIDQYTGNSRAPQWFHYYGAKTTDSLRIIYQYGGDEPDRTGDNMGQPLTTQYGRLLDKDFTFMAALHASIIPYTPTPGYIGAIDPNDVDDPSQPKVAQFANMQNVLSLPLYTQTFLPSNKSMYDFITGVSLASEDQTGADVKPGGHYRKNIDDMNLLTSGGQPGIHANGNDFESLCFGFGPYTFENGQQIRIVKISGFAGISREKAMEIGKKYLAKTLQVPPINYLPPNFRFPTTDPQDIAKDKWMGTGIDSVHQLVSRAKYNFKTGWKTPVAPPPPTSTSVLGTGVGVEITWSDLDAEALSGFQGYRIMRKVSAQDTTFYQQVATTSPTDKAATHNFVDSNILFGASYYYYIQAGVRIAANDLNAHPSERGKIIWSNRIWYPNNTFTQGKRKYSDELSEIVMVPNPYNYMDPLLRGYGDTGWRGIRFFNLPITVTIKIFTEYGDLVTTIEHDKPLTKDGFEVWDMMNDNRQTIASGIYLVVFQTPDGRLSYQKLVVAR